MICQIALNQVRILCWQPASSIISPPTNKGEVVAVVKRKLDNSWEPKMCKCQGAMLRVSDLSVYWKH